MKKVLLTLLIILIFQNISLAQTNGVSFIYVNGANNNDEKMTKWFLNGVDKLHHALKCRFEKNDEIRAIFLKNGSYKINPEPVIFFWGYRSSKELSFVREHIDIGRAFTLANEVRGMITSYLHDTIWVQKSHNMIPILDDLNELVKKEYQNGNQSVIFGYSAGSFIAYEYLFNKLPYINMNVVLNSVEVDDGLMEYIKQHPIKDTCISALTKENVGVVSSDGRLIINCSDERFRQNFLNMDKATEQYCTPPGALKGIVNFATPLVLFYSDMADPAYELTYYNVYMIKYILENDLFWISINYREDPFGFPTKRNLSIEEMEEIMNINIESPSGFIFDNSRVWGKRFFLFAHTSYWKTRGTFSNAVVKTYLDAYKSFYDSEYQK